MEKILRLSCHIDNDNNPINSLAEGLRISMEGQLEKNSPSLGRNAIYQKTSRINKLVSSQVDFDRLFSHPICASNS
jgi:ubiquitin carboxyl-terminal hydrolase 14